MTKAWEQAIMENRQAVLDGWSAAAAERLPGGVASPVAEALAGELGMLLDALAGGSAPDGKLARITRILAVQEIPPSQALALFHDLLPHCETLSVSARASLRDRLDQLLLQAFDSYMQHRETIYQLKVDEGRRRMHMALRRAEA